MPAHGVMFHHFHGGGHVSSQGSISADELDEMIEFVGPERILGAQEWLDKLRRDVLGPDDVCLTFDDALRCQFDIAVPVLEARKLTGFWFVYSSIFEGNLEMLEIYRHYRSTHFETMDDFYEAFDRESAKSEFYPVIEREMSGFDRREYLRDSPFYTDSDRRFRFVRDKILGSEAYHAIMDQMVERAGYDYEELGSKLWLDDSCLNHLQQSGHVVGLHSYRHPTNLVALSVGEQTGEYRKNFEHLQRVSGDAPTTMSHPCNSYSETTLEILRSLGIELGFRANMKAISPRSYLEYPREDHAIILRKMRS